MDSPPRQSRCWARLMGASLVAALIRRGSGCRWLGSAGSSDFIGIGIALTAGAPFGGASLAAAPEHLIAVGRRRLGFGTGAALVTSFPVLLVALVGLAFTGGREGTLRGAWLRSHSNCVVLGFGGAGAGTAGGRGIGIRLGGTRGGGGTAGTSFWMLRSSPCRSC